jgi:hypothetical protein
MEWCETAPDSASRGPEDQSQLRVRNKISSLRQVVEITGIMIKEKWTTARRRRYIIARWSFQVGPDSPSADSKRRRAAN